MISSLRNPKVKLVRRLQTSRKFRQREGAFVVEGDRWLDEISNAPVEPLVLFVTPDWLQKGDNERRLHPFPGKFIKVSEGVMAYASDNESPPGLLAVLPIEPRTISPEPTLLLILDRVNNPGNMGSVLRSAAAAGADAALLGPGCVDPYNPKAVRGGMGAQLRMPIVTAGWDEIERLTTGLVVRLAAADGDLPYDRVDWHSPSALLMGSEARGAGQQAERLAMERIQIPMHAGSDSLNLAAAASVILFEAARQRRANGRA